MRKENTPIYIVSGLPRSGTSMMMKILEAGGIEPLVDNIRSPDESNPQGYYELEAVKTIKEDSSWLSGAQGKAVKIISKLLPELPPDYSYKVIFMKRRLEEIIGSQQAMLARGGGQRAAEDEELITLYRHHLEEIEEWLSTQSNIETLYADYNEIITEPESGINEIAGFLDIKTGLEKMSRAVEKGLYRQKSSSNSDHADHDKIGQSADSGSDESNAKIEAQLKALGYM